ncbi:MAG: DUF4922 domain-containing protein [Bacteroidales bacterium]|nr:DUF4922 domain-containing protein [Bacteroidales bacterium]
MAKDIDKFVHDQLSVWPQVAAKYRALKTAPTRQLPFGGLLVTLQSNPGRLPIFDHGCPLCEENYMEHQHTLPFEGHKGRKYNILVNRAPVFPNHLVITRDIHTPQTIWHRFPDMLDLACGLEGYIVYYNSVHSGTSVPGHAHFQACPKGYMPLERTADRLLRAISAEGGKVPESLAPEIEFLTSVSDAQLFHYLKFNRGIFMLRAKTSKSMAKLFYRLLDCTSLFAEETEPRFNAFAYSAEGEFRAIVILRREERPGRYFKKGDENFAISPGAAEMAGFVVVPKEKDFPRLSVSVLEEIFADVTLTEADQKRILWRLVRTQPRIEVGIAHEKEISFEIISDGAGPQKVTYREGKIDYNGVLYDELLFEAPAISTLFAEPSFILYGEDGDRRYAGALKFVVDAGKVQAVNIIGLEDYLVGALSAGGTSVDALQKAAIEIRAWAMKAMQERKAAHGKAHDDGCGISGTPSLVTWLDTTHSYHLPAREQCHKSFDICAGRHCRPYFGIMGIDTTEVRMAVDETWGVLE